MTNPSHQVPGRVAIGIASIFLACSRFAFAETVAGTDNITAPPEIPGLGTAILALDEGRPDRAIKDLEKLANVQGNSDSFILEARILLLEAYVRNGDHEKAIELVIAGSSAESRRIAFWKAQAFAATGNYYQASALLETITLEPGDPLGPEIFYLRSVLLENRDDLDRAIDVLEPLFSVDADLRAAGIGHLRTAEIRYRQGLFLEALEQLAAMSRTAVSIDTRATYLRGRILLAQGQWEAAEESLSSVVNYDNNPDPRLLQVAHLALAEAYAGMGSDQKSEQVLRSFIERFPESPFLGTVFQRLEALGVFLRSPMEPSLTVWTMSHQVNLKAIATYYLAVAMTKTGDASEALNTIENFLAQHGEHPLRIDALLRHTELALELRDWAKATSSLSLLRESARRPEILAYTTYLEARTAFAEGNMIGAAEKFSKLKEYLGSIPQGTPGFNLALAALGADNESEFIKEASLIQEQGPENDYASLLLERALLLALRGDPRAESLLTDFSRLFPRHPSVANAQIALAELAFLAFPPRPVTAREHLTIAKQVDLSKNQAEHIDYLSMWIALSAGDDSEAIASARKFIQKWPKSALVPEMHMKLGEIYFQRSAYSDATAQWELLSADFPDSPLAEVALFSAGHSARLTMQPGSLDRAIDIWGRVVDMDGDLTLEAREQQGLAKLDLGKEREAISVFDSILESALEPSDELLYSVLCSKGQALFILSSQSPELLPEAIANFDRILDSDQASGFWKNQAGVRKAKCLERQGKTAEAIETYSAVARSAATSQEANTPEFLWSYRAGFEAVRLLEGQSMHDSAIEMAEFLAKSGGVRDQQAAGLANRLRLKHFIYGE